jgi:hypothetical protein
VIRPRALAAPLVCLLAMSLGGCVDSNETMARCKPDQRLAIVAQSVPDAIYIPCVDVLPAGWRISWFEVDEHGTSFRLRSDRAEHPVEVSLSDGCRRGDATPIAPRAAGVRSYLSVHSISPDYMGTFYDVFSGGCVAATFDFVSGPHVALVDELRRIVGLYPRRQLRQELEAELGIPLDP